VIDDDERAKMLAVPLCGAKVVQRLAALGIARLSDLRGQDPFELMELVNLVAGREIWRPPLAIHALENLIAAAEQEHACPRS
jgi:hypothetical protein